MARVGTGFSKRLVIASAAVISLYSIALFSASSLMIAPPRPRVSRETRPSLGIGARSAPEGGVEVIASIGPARRAGIRPGDRILRIDDRSVVSPAQVADLVVSEAPGRRFRIAASRVAPSGEVAALLVDVESELLSATPEEEGLRYENVEFENASGQRLRGWYLPAPPAPGGAPAVAYGHGNGANRAHWSAMARDVNAAGIAQLFFDFAGRGDSDGQTITLGFREADDLEAALDWLAARPEIDASRLALAGRSMGAVAAIYAASRRTDLRALVLDSPFSDLRTLVDEQVRRRFLPPLLVRPVLFLAVRLRAGYDPDVVRPIELMPTLHVPTLLLHGTADDVVPPHHAHDLSAAAARGDVELVEIPGVGHNGSRPADAVRLTVRFLNVHLDRRR